MMHARSISCQRVLALKKQSYPEVISYALNDSKWSIFFLNRKNAQKSSGSSHEDESLS